MQKIVYMLPEHFLKMDKTQVVVAKKGEEPSDLAYWLSRPPAERILMVELIRAEYHNWTDDTIPRLQRVYRIVKLESS